MADTEQQVVMLGDDSPAQTQCITENGEIITVTQGGEVVSGDVGEDILQQALDEASEGYENADVEYTTEAESIAVVADSNGTLSDANGVTYSYVTTNIPNVSDSQTVVTASQVEPGHSLIRVAAAPSDSQVTTMDPQTEVVTIPTTVSGNSVLATISPGTVVSQNQGVQQQIVQPQMVRIVQPGQVLGQDVVQHTQQIVQHQQQQQQQPSPDSQGGSPQTLPQQTHVQLSQSASGTPGAITVLTNSGGGSGPLGSSGNPIRIIQQGNKYTSVQQLTAEQVAQIMQVVQQQQLAQSTSQGGGSSVLFNSQTQTRIVYRVIYPSELHSKSSGGGSTSANSPGSTPGPKTITVPRQMVTLGGPKRTYKKRSRDEEEKIDGPELSKEERETKKKHRPRTRSGRVSRPPKHMVQDYKHIHHLDWEEDYDDSDGGYSDYHVSDNEEGRNEDKEKEASYVSTGLGSSKPKNHNCEKCDKAYIGAAGLARHYRLNPDHGNPDDVLPLIPTSSATNGVGIIMHSDDESSTQDSISSTTSLPSSAQQTSPVIVATQSSASASASVAVSAAVSASASVAAAVSASVATPASTSTIPATATTAPHVRHTPRGVHRAKHAYAQENTPARRKARLKDLVRQCKTEELMEVVLPRLTRNITLWEFLVMKVEKGRPSRPHIADVLNEYELLNKQVGKMCSDYLVPVEESSSRSPLEKHRNVLQVTNQAIAEALGLNMGKYLVRDTPKVSDPIPGYKIISSSPSSTPESEAVKTDALLGGGTKRKVQVVTPDEFMQLTKRQCLGDNSISQTVVDKLTTATPSSASATATSSTTSSNSFSHIKLKEALARGAVVLGQNYVNREVEAAPEVMGSTMVVGSSGIEGERVEMTAVINAQDGPHQLEAETEEENGEAEGVTVVLKTVDEAAAGGGTEGGKVLVGPDNTVIHTVNMEGQVMEANTVNGSSSNSEAVMNSIGSEFTHQPEAVTDSESLNQNVTTEVIMSESPGEGEPQQQQQPQQVVLEQGLSEEALKAKLEGQEEVEGGIGLLQADAQLDVKVDEEKKDSEILLVSNNQQVETPSSTQALPIETQTSVLQEGSEVNHGEMVVNAAPAESVAQQHIVAHDGQTVLFTDDGGQTYYQQNLHMEGRELAVQGEEDQSQQQQQQQQQQQEIPLEAGSQQLVSMETPDGLLEGQLVTNEDGTQFLIHHQQLAEQQVYQTPEGLILIQNPDGTLRIHNNGDQQIPLETVQALLAVDGEGQVQVEANSVEQAT